MTTTGPLLVPGHRRRVERFAQLLDEAAGGRRHHVRSRADQDLVPLVAVGRRVTQLPTYALAPRLDPEFRTGLRAMLVATAEREGIGVTAVSERPGPLGVGPVYGAPRDATTVGGRARARGAVIVGVAVGTLALSGMSAASGDAMPGDALYGIKRSTERAQLALAASDASRGQLHLEFARTRSAEAGAVERDAPGLPAVLGDMDSDTREGVRLITGSAVDRRDPLVLAAVDRFVTAQRRSVVGLLGAAPVGPARDRVLESIGLLDAVSARTAALRESLACGDTGTGSDSLGPLPGTCPAAGAGTRGRPATGAPAEPQRTENTTPSGGPSSSGSPAPTGSPSSEPSQPATEETEGGLLSDLGRILGGLLGG